MGRGFVGLAAAFATAVVTALGTAGGAAAAVQTGPAVTLLPGDSPDTGYAAVADEGATIQVAAAVTGAASTRWTYTGVDANCRFGDPAAATTTFTCDDAGPRTLTLAADDGVDPTVRATEHVWFSNVAPTATLSTSPRIVGVGYTATARIAITDPGPRDSFTCTIDWGDGTGSLPAAAVGNACTATHVFTAPYDHHPIAHVVDADGAFTDTNETTVSVKQPPTVDLPGVVDGPTGFAREVGEGGSLSLAGVVGGASSLQWSAAGGTGACTFTQPNAAATAVTCDDDGLYALTLTATDEVGQQRSATVHVLVDNVPPTATLAVVAGPGGAASATAAIGDPGNDSWRCTFTWGDGTTSVVAATARTCAATHTYTVAGARTVGVTVTDGDGGTASAASVVVVPALPPNLLLQRLADLARQWLASLQHNRR